MQLQRKLTQWKDYSPEAISKMSSVAIQCALEDARADILTLAKLLIEAGYPRHGTSEESQTICQFAKKVQQLISHAEAVEI